ncbi:CBS domain-containing protein [Hahella sp. KA22]|uniref:nucleotidyltransferase family protein n=1 Tax=Hahella sp. KA22 TaxID=1628392 RepID=UPI000FDE1193|nr:nucleotidyltransferase family protein [Hahella sp. KA22]AZZ91275.1 CBS domain-containing protein [Hahella sp. KA22]QAY54644.1 CBS domain-containing protein [Hahella sp. KA22]
MCADWRQVLIQPQASIEQAIEVIEKATLRIALVVDEQQRLLGTVTDGDVRRALINHTPLSASVVRIMESEPKVAEINDSRARILSIMERRKLLHIPIVDSQRRVVGLETLLNIAQQPRYDNPVMLMAGGLGTRLRPLTNNCPKPLLKVGNKPILENILESFASSGFSNFYISVYYKPEMVMDYFGDGSKWGVNIQYVRENTPLGTGGALGLLPNDMPDLPVLVMNGDILTRVNFEHLLRFHQQQRGAATLCVREYEFQVPYGVVQAEDQRITSIVEKPTHSYFVNAGIYVLEPQVIRDIKPEQHLDMPTLLQQLMECRKDVAMFPIHEYWLDIGRMNDFEKAQKDYMEDFA